MRYRFDENELDTETLELTRSGEPVEVEPQVFEVLAHLIANRDRVVPKEELLDEVWGDRFVSESALTTRIKQARKAIGDDGQKQLAIKTFHGRGYRFVADVTESDAHTAPAAPPVMVVQSIPTTRYAEGDGASIAYQTFGEGPDLVMVSGFGSNVEVQWEHPHIASILRSLGSFCRVTILDKRGVGLSDRMPQSPPPLETRADDLMAVMDTVGIERAVVLGSSEGGSLSVVFTASHPERVEKLILHNTWVKGPSLDSGEGAKFAHVTATKWGQGRIYRALAPSLGADERGREFLARFERQSATPRVASQLLQLNAEIDISGVLAAVAVPTLVLHRRDDRIVPLSHGQALASGIPNAELVELDGFDHYLMSGPSADLLDAIERFITGERATAVSVDRHLATIVFVDIVGSTETARRLGDAGWSKLLDQFQAAAVPVVEQNRGELVKTTGDGLLATFDGPGRAVQAAAALRDETARLGLDLRAGVHTAEIERRGDDVAGIGVHLASRVADAAHPGEVWVSRTVTDLVAGTGLAFTSRGTHALKGLDQPWELFAAEL